MRKKVIAGNWKMNKTPSETAAFITELSDKVKQTKDIVICAVPFVCIPAALKASKRTKIKIAAQNMHYEDKGAFTGEVSAKMLVDLGVQYVIIGHSERRQYYNETDATVNRKVLKAIKAGLKPIICVGESLEQRETGVTADFVRYQVGYALNGVSSEDMKNIVIAYEPIWAIGTGKTATNEQANEVCRTIRQALNEKYGRKVANATYIQYGGSVNVKNAAELFSMSDIDGGLVGGASLKSDDFCKIVNYKG
ncbi:MAG TPA: triose-phosphate isomerase [Clostridia bacterium]|jgi:triosephosphate isomerase|nr:triose-phosphate isomerase [Clostridiaceae bacterium]HOF25859.1 triose-phosphate isomerase [Clostridia bacterium]HOM33698.1 triose-phosphate isomerase [Clostridia bacterium]HOR88884.1 triose-phosphate isomerase [Clostridia bacterium]HOT71115.1 triose-phosphate isomerase [Clostridia bacterium]